MGGGRGGGRRHYHNLMYLTSHQTASAILLLAHSTFPRLRGSVLLLHHTFWESRQPYGSLLFLLPVLFLFVTPCSSQFFFVNVTVQEVRVLFHFVTPWLPSVTFRSYFSSLSVSKKQWSFFLFVATCYPQLLCVFLLLRRQCPRSVAHCPLLSLSVSSSSPQLRYVLLSRQYQRDAVLFLYFSSPLPLVPFSYPPFFVSFVVQEVGVFDGPSFNFCPMHCGENYVFG